MGVRARAGRRLAPASVGNAAVIGGKQHDGVLRDAKLFEMVENLPQAVIHGLDHRGVDGFFLVNALVEVFLHEPPVGLPGRMDGVVGHVQVKRLAGLDRLLDGLVGLDGQSFGEVDLLAVVLLQAGHIPDAVFRAFGSPGGREVLVAPVADRPAGAVPCDVHVEAVVARVLARRAVRTEVRLAAMNRVIAPLVQDSRQGHYRRLNALNPPCRRA